MIAAQTPQGDWKVSEGSDEYRAWKSWLQKSWGRTFFPRPILVVPTQWPPTTDTTCQIVAGWFNDIIRQVNKDGKNRHWRAEYPVPEPWTGTRRERSASAPIY